ncbi:sensor histidine kinase [Nocardioides litoris]|uniref:sensor histidine kinase n=1 Tax=Nocardioides litoris TaxID=1926648 RepID=UPI001FE71602|nr:HAMP domain-containing sensor histidine kinase [Nocardioides litoris]
MRLPASLTSRLVVTAVLLVAVVSLLLGTATTLAMRASLTDQLDQRVLASVANERGPRGDGGRPPGPRPDGGGQVDGGDGPLGNQAPGTLFALPAQDRGVVLTGTGATDLDSAVLDRLADVPTDGVVRQLDLGSLGSYRVVAATTGDGGPGPVVTGLPTADLDESVASLVRLELLLGLLAVVTAGLAARAVVRRQLRPLREVAATAHSVSSRPLDAGEIGVTERVPGHLTDERTEVGQVGAALNTLLAHVETSLDARHESEQRVRRFVADASHELRTPLTTIAGYTELARRRPDDPAAAATALAKVADESRRMTTLVEDLLLLARLDSGRPLEREPVDLTRLLLEALSDARVVAPDHRWRLDLPDEAVEVHGDEQRLHQVVTNLLTNARKYTPPGTTVTVTARRDGFRVHDDGPGFPAALVPHAFERFARADAARHREGGVGLGLALVEAIVTAHGGTVVLTSEPGDTLVDVRLSDDLGPPRLSDNLASAPTVGVRPEAEGGQT